MGMLEDEFSPGTGSGTYGSGGEGGNCCAWEVSGGDEDCGRRLCSVGVNSTTFTLLCVFCCSGLEEAENVGKVTAISAWMPSEARAAIALGCRTSSGRLLIIERKDIAGMVNFAASKQSGNHVK